MRLNSRHPATHIYPEFLQKSLRVAGILRMSATHAPSSAWAHPVTPHEDMDDLDNAIAAICDGGIVGDHQECDAETRG